MLLYLFVRVYSALVIDWYVVEKPQYQKTVCSYLEASRQNSFPEFETRRPLTMRRFRM